MIPASSLNFMLREKYHFEPSAIQAQTNTCSTAPKTVQRAPRTADLVLGTRSHGGQNHHLPDVMWHRATSSGRCGFGSGHRTCSAADLFAEGISYLTASGTARRPLATAPWSLGTPSSATNAKTTTYSAALATANSPRTAHWPLGTGHPQPRKSKPTPAQPLWAPRNQHRAPRIEQRALRTLSDGSQHQHLLDHMGHRSIGTEDQHLLDRTGYRARHRTARTGHLGIAQSALGSAHLAPQLLETVSHRSPNQRLLKQSKNCATGTEHRALGTGHPQPRKPKPPTAASTE